MRRKTTLAERVCAALDCEIRFAPRSSRQYYHATACATRRRVAIYRSPVPDSASDEHSEPHVARQLRVADEFLESLASVGHAEHDASSGWVITDAGRKWFRGFDGWDGERI
jgi:hypothetical protein